MLSSITDPEIRRQIQTCERLEADFVVASADALIAFCEPFDAECGVVHGLRSVAAGRQTGWHVWTGDADADDIGFFNVLHVRDFVSLCPAVGPFLGLAPGWRFIVDGGGPRAWFDPSLL